MLSRQIRKRRALREQVGSTRQGRFSPVLGTGYSTPKLDARNNPDVESGS